MGRYEPKRYRRSKRSRYSVAEDELVTKPKRSVFSVFVVVILLVTAIALGFFLAKLSDGLINVDAILKSFNTKKIQLVEQMSQNKADPVKKAELQPKSDQNHFEQTELPIKIILPELDSSDEPIREALISATPQLESYLNTGQIIRKYMQIANDFSQGNRVTKHLGFLKLHQVFMVDSKGTQTVIAIQSYQRYNALAAVIDAINIPATLSVYKKFRPLLLQVFSEFSYPDGYNLDDIFIKAATQILSAPIIEKPIPVIKASSYYKFADPELEALNPVHKQILRMGAENTRLIQNKIRILVGELVNSKE